MLSIGIVGLPNAGKSTLFKALTKKEVLIADYPFATIDPNVGVVEVLDERLAKLAVLSGLEKKVPAVIEFVDIAGLVRGANKGEGLGNQFLARIREVDAILYVLRAFEDANIQHVENRVDPAGDLETLKAELMLKDLETVERHISKIEKEKGGTDKEAIASLLILEKIKASLDDGVMANKTFEEYETEKEKAIVEKLKKELQFLTAKRGILLFNTSGSDPLAGGQTPADLSSVDFPQISMNVREELDSAEFSKDERKELGLQPSQLQKLLGLAQEILNLITFFTIEGAKETRAWMVERGSLAPEAAGVIHTDFQEKFIRADVIQWDKLLEAGSWQNAKAQGVMNSVGKDYVMRDGDVMEVKHGN